MKAFDEDWKSMARGEGAIHIPIGKRRRYRLDDDEENYHPCRR